MTSKKARSMAGLPWIAAMAFFMQALDATPLYRLLRIVLTVPHSPCSPLLSVIP